MDILKDKTGVESFKKKSLKLQIKFTSKFRMEQDSSCISPYSGVYLGKLQKGNL